MKLLFKIIAGVLCLALVGASLAGWWFLHEDTMKPPDLPGIVQTGSLEHDGLSRSWLAYVPASRAERPALLLIMHGSKGNSERMRVTTSRYGFDILAEQYGFVAVYPDGYEQHFNDCRGGASYSANLKNIDDVGFLTELVQLMVIEQGVDPSRVFATGMSNGGHMAYRLGLEAPALVAGIAAVAASLPVTANLGCTPSEQGVATLIINGTEDPVNPYAGGLVEIPGDASRGEVISTEATAGYWAGLAGHSGPGQPRAWPDRAPDDGTTVTSIEWSGMGKPPVSLVTVVGGGHSFPHPVFTLPRILGATSHEFDGARVIWSFFSELGQGRL